MLSSRAEDTAADDEYVACAPLPELDLDDYRDLTVEVTGSAGSPGGIRPCPRFWPGFLATTRTRLRTVL